MAIDRGRHAVGVGFGLSAIEHLQFVGAHEEDATVRVALALLLLIFIVAFGRAPFGVEGNIAKRLLGVDTILTGNHRTFLHFPRHALGAIVGFPLGGGILAVKEHHGSGGGGSRRALQLLLVRARRLGTGRVMDVPLGAGDKGGVEVTFSQKAGGG